jgi:hypothetical protein
MMPMCNRVPEKLRKVCAAVRVREWTVDPCAKSRVPGHLAPGTPANPTAALIEIDDGRPARFAASTHVRGSHHFQSLT